MTARDWPWLLARSGETGWAQLTPAQQAETNLEAFRGQVQTMLTQALSVPGSSAQVAREEGTPVGYLVVSVVPDELTQVPVGLFVDIYVEPAWRGKGVSSFLTAAGEGYLRAMGLRQVKRWVAAHNQASLKHALKDGCQVERFQLVKKL
jgi:GNAT superfamily N-acetyltransferase